MLSSFILYRFKDFFSIIFFFFLEIDIMKPFFSLNDYLLSLFIMSNYSFLNSIQMTNLLKTMSKENYTDKDLFEIELFFINNKEDIEDLYFFKNIENYIQKID
jgi:hypothetical protein